MVKLSMNIYQNKYECQLFVQMSNLFVGDLILMVMADDLMVTVSISKIHNLLIISSL